MLPFFTSFKQRFHALPLRRRLSLLIGVCAGITALMCMLAVVGSGLWLQKERALEETTEVARTLAFALEAPVAFGDLQGMQNALTLLRARPQVESASVHNPQGQVLVFYGLPPAAFERPATDEFSLTRLRTRQAIMSESDVIGHVVVVNRLSRLWQTLGLAILAIGLASTAGLVLSVLLAQHIARAITQPIDTLAQASREIAKSHQYAQRLTPGGSDEIGTAIQAFNSMLDEIQTRGEALVQANLELERRVAERTHSLQCEKERAEAASLAKTRFLANMSHELRTPLNAVIGAAQLLQDGHDTAQSQARLVGSIRDSGTKLLSLIENILDLSRIESGLLDLVLDDFSLLDCVESAFGVACITARIKGLEMACIIDPQLGNWRRGDATRLRQVLLNVLGNAVKFTPQGEVVLRVDAGQEPHSLRMSVSDTGIGIGPASLAQVFEPFRQADDASNRRFGGSGLGLSISRQLVQAMGGRLSVHSQLAQGSRFDIELVLAPAQHPTPAEPVPLQSTVLFFEPHGASAQALGAQLKRLGCNAQPIDTAEGLRPWAAKIAQNPTHFWLMLNLEAPQADSVLNVAITSLKRDHILGMAGTDSVTAEANQQKFELAPPLLKPLLRLALHEHLSLCTAKPATPSGGPLHPAPTGSGLRHILVVEDDTMNQLIVCNMLHRAGHKTSSALNGQQALDMLAAQPFDVVLMDWQMPDMDGLEVTRRLRSGAAGTAAEVVPIIALTANAFAEDRIACLAAGMNDYLTKPILMSNLLAGINRWSRPLGESSTLAVT
jgi:signal transduction histidine kinase/ActR/RegA family two-component response regulator